MFFFVWGDLSVKRSEANIQAKSAFGLWRHMGHVRVILPGDTKWHKSQSHLLVTTRVILQVFLSIARHIDSL